MQGSGSWFSEKENMITPYTTFAWQATKSPYAQHCPQLLVGDGWYGEGGTIEILKNMPQGKKAVIFNGYDGFLFNNPNDYLTDANGVKRRSLWFDKGIEHFKTHVTQLCQQYKDAGVEPDMLVLDGEAGMGVWSCSEEDKKTIVADPRYPALATKWNLPKTYDEIWPNYLDFNYNVCRYQNSVMKVAAYDIFKKFFPNMVWSNFGDSPLSKAMAAKVPDFNNHAQPIPTSSAPIFSPVLYAYVGNLGRYVDPSYITSEWKCVAWQLNSIRAGYAAVPKAKFMPWIAPKELSNVLSLGYWAEMIYHASILCGPQFLWFNHNASYDPAQNKWIVDEYAAKRADVEFTYVMDEIYKAAKGLPFGAPIDPGYLFNYSSTAMVSKCKLADGSVLGRVTFKGPPVNATSITITVEGKTITVNKEPNSPGAWFTLPA